MDPQAMMMLQALQSQGGGGASLGASGQAGVGNGQTDPGLGGALGTPTTGDQTASLGLPNFQMPTSSMVHPSSMNPQATGMIPPGGMPPGGMIGVDAPVSGAW